MSRENVEIVERSTDAFQSRDLDAYDEAFTPGFE
jgi:hypothetical protein